MKDPLAQDVSNVGTVTPIISLNQNVLIFVGSRSDLGPSRMDQSNYLMKQQQQHPQQHPLNYKGSSSVTPSGMKAEDMSRDSKKLSELRERLPGGRPGYPYTSSPYARPEDSRLNTLVCDQIYPIRILNWSIYKPQNICFTVYSVFVVLFCCSVKCFWAVGGRG